MPDSNSNEMKQASLSDLAGRRLGDYQVIRRLGRGAMAEVYLAEQISLGRRVAIKFLKSDLAKDETYVKRFQNEARSAASLVHANIVQIYEVGYAEGLHYIAQEYVPGTNLSDLLARKGSLDVAFGLAVFRQTIAALIKSADQGIVHRDIKPENILVNQTGEVKVADFGLARVIDKDQTLNLTQIGVTMGTPLYMSPEQVEGKPLDTRSDLYSLGITMYHVLSGLPPFRGDNALVVAMKHLKEQPDRLENLRPDLPPGLCRLVHKMIEKKPQDRYQAARALLVELRALYKELGAENWSEEWNEWTSGELTSLNDSRIEATQQLSELMQTQALLTQTSNWSKRIAAMVICGLLIGLSTAWATRQPFLLKEQGLESEIANQETVEQQKNFAMIYKGGKDIAAWEKVEQRFPDKKNLQHHLFAKKNLAKIYLENKNYTTALRYFQELKGYANKTYKLYGMTGEAIIYDIQKRPEADAVWANLELERTQIKTDRVEPSHPDEFLGSDMTALYNNQVEARRTRAGNGSL